MEQELYSLDVAKVICELTGYSDALDVREDGVHVKDEYLDADLTGQAFTWIPACEMDWPGAPDPLTAPALPIPFSARNLAAFMLDGAGQGLQSMFGHIEHGPDELELADLGTRATKIRKALREAYALAQEAQSVAGADNHDEQQRAAEMLRNEPRALMAVARHAQAAAETRHSEWLRAMVHQLLRPSPPVVATTDAPEAATAQTIVHSTKVRRDTLTPVIEAAQKQCRNPQDTAEVWAVLQVLAQKKTPPLIGATEEGLQYFRQGEAAIFNREALRKRLAR